MCVLFYYEDINTTFRESVKKQLMVNLSVKQTGKCEEYGMGMAIVTGR